LLLHSCLRSASRSGAPWSEIAVLETIDRDRRVYSHGETIEQRLAGECACGVEAVGARPAEGQAADAGEYVNGNITAEELRDFGIR
jgi:hypothetical protein